MMKKRLLMYCMVLTVPLLLGLAAWQANRYAELTWEIAEQEALQDEWVESNKRLVAGIAVLSSSERIEHIAKYELGLTKKRPEEILQIRIEGGGRNDG